MIRILGIPVHVNPSWAVISVLVGATFFLRAMDAGDSVIAGIVVALAGSLLFMAGVLFHEMSHALVARRRGVAVRSVTLFVFGGYTEMEAAPPDSELAVALAGPVASLGAAALLWAASWAAGGGSAADALGLLAVVNLAVAGFNLLPGLPLDGGRILRSVLARRFEDPQRATAVAADAGRVIGIALALAGLALASWYPVALWNVVVGWFLYRIATESRPIVPAGMLAVAPTGPVPRSATAADVESARGSGGYVPVVDRGRVVGVVLPGDSGRAADVMVRLRPGDLVGPDDGVSQRSRPRIVVENGRMVGVVPPCDPPGAG